MITGEPIPVGKTAGTKVVGGTVNQTGAFDFRATAVGADTALARKISEDRFTFLEEGVFPPAAAGVWTTTWEPGPSELADVRRTLPR
jgi:hypothetical protein